MPPRSSHRRIARGNPRWRGTGQQPAGLQQCARPGAITLGFAGTGRITAAVVTGPAGSPGWLEAILVSPRNTERALTRLEGERPAR